MSRLVTDDDMSMIFRAADLPDPVREYRFASPRRWRFDYCWVEERVCIEVDGGNWKPGGGRHGGDDDREKMNNAASLGWLVFHASHAQLISDPWSIMDLIRTALWKRRTT